MIPSLWLPVASLLTEIVAHAAPVLTELAGKAAEGGAAKMGEILISNFTGRRLSPKPLIEMRAHFVALHFATDALAKETHAGMLSERYDRLRSEWLAQYAPAQTVLHNIDPYTLSHLGIYSRKLAALLGQPLTVSEKTLSEALEAELSEISYDTSSHLCTLCLQVVRTWSDSQTMAGGLRELSATLMETLDSLDHFIQTTWPTGDLA